MGVTGAGKIRLLGALLAVTVMQAAVAGVLPEDRADVLYHSYDGGGVEVTGPSILMRKGVGNNFSFWGNYYVDAISSASIDVLSTASPYEEERTETSLGMDYLYGDTVMSLGFTKSDESDFVADSAFFNVSQDVFGGLTTVSMGYARGWNEVRRNGDPIFEEEVDRRNYRLGLSQVLTKNLLLGLSWETITDEGYLNNPYRSVRYLDAGNPIGYSYQGEVYPNTRTSHAAAVRSRYFLQYRAAVFAEYRFFTDTWGIDAHTAELGYTHPTTDGWIYEGSVRYYSQEAASFYSDLYPAADYQNYLARDKELAAFTSYSVSLGVTYQFNPDRFQFLERGTVNFYYDYMYFDYEDFRNVTAGGIPGSEALYNFNADVWQLFVSFWF